MEIKNRQELKELLTEECRIYLGSDKASAECRYRQPMKYNIYRFVRALRIYEYRCYKRDHAGSRLKSIFISCLVKAADRKKNRLGLLAGIEVTPGFMDRGVRICHPNVIINGYVGEHCIFHGNNVVGNKKTGAKSEVPHIGCSVDIGVGAIIIGNVAIADNCVIGAGAVVTRSFSEPGSVIAGVPANVIGHN